MSVAPRIAEALAGTKVRARGGKVQCPAFNRNSSETRPQRTTRRDAPVRCASCGRQVKRRGRRQLYCSTRCRKRAHYAESVRRGDFSAFPLSDAALGTIPPKKTNEFNALQRAKSLSSHGILAPARVLALEVFGRVWREAISSEGIAIQVSRFRARALVNASAA